MSTFQIPSDEIIRLLGTPVETPGERWARRLRLWLTDRGLLKLALFTLRFSGRDA